ncbi:unnamed protein product [Adineta steineri]|uniref:Uncharacterized protein n=1 Tax=Adineta steineri TaxID=433720 RepID=A0A816EAS4_9BILA|nr:unnamed protein product [Adineta steineri]CAF1650139.1 unnamed protein product [Adineta steineri]
MEKSPSSSPLASTNTKRSFQRKKLQYQERITEQQLPSSSFLTAPASAPTAATTTTTTTVTTLMPNYLTTDSIRKVSPSNISHNFGDKQIKKKFPNIVFLFFFSPFLNLSSSRHVII